MYQSQHVLLLKSVILQYALIVRTEGFKSWITRKCDSRKSLNASRRDSVLRVAAVSHDKSSRLGSFPSFDEKIKMPIFHGFLRDKSERRSIFQIVITNTWFFVKNQNKTKQNIWNWKLERLKIFLTILVTHMSLWRH